MRYHFVIKKALSLLCLVCFFCPLFVRAAPADTPLGTRPLLGMYATDQRRFLVRENDGKLELLLEKAGDEQGRPVYDVQVLEALGGDQYRWLQQAGYGIKLVVVRFVRDAAGMGIECRLGDDTAKRLFYGPERAGIVRIKPAYSLEELKKRAKSAAPPAEAGAAQTPQLISVTSADAGIKLDVRYAATNNFLGLKLYEEAQAFLQRPAAEALGRVQQQLKLYGYGLLVHDAYRPWYVTKMIWDATPAEQRSSLDDPAQGSRHNRGAAVDVSLYDIMTGATVGMISGYDEFSPRASAAYVGGTSLERWRRDLLRQLMEREGFSADAAMWWHFDYHDWQQYPIMNKSFADIAPVFRLQVNGFQYGRD